MHEANKFCHIPVSLVLLKTEKKIEQVVRSYNIPGVKDKKVALNEILKKLEEGSNNQTGTGTILLSPVYRIAISTAAILVLIFLLHFFTVPQQFENNSQNAITFRLPDHSRVVLNQNSTASFPKNRWDRKVKLDGTAYFEVQKGKKFIVKTKEGDVSVLGTRFQVKEDEGRLTVDCYEGKVMVTRNGQTAIVTAGNSLDYFHGEKKMTTLENEYPAEARFKKTFSNEELENVLTDLENFFQVQIRLKNPTIKHFSGSLETANIESALKVVCRSLDLTYTFDQEGIVINEKEKNHEHQF